MVVEVGRFKRRLRPCQYAARIVEDSGLTDLLLGAGGSLDAVAALDNVRLETDGTRAAMKLEEEAASIAQDRAHLVATP